MQRFFAQLEDPRKEPSRHGSGGGESTQPLRRALALDGRSCGTVEDTALTQRLDEVTVTAWVLLNGEQPILSSAQDGARSTGFGLAALNGKLLFIGSAPSSLHLVSSNCRMPLYQWTHVAFTLTPGAPRTGSGTPVEPTHTLRLFVNGRVEAEHTGCGPIIASRHPLRIGSLGGGSARSGVTRAHMAQLSFWLRALSPNEIRAVYKRVIPADTSGLRGFFTGEMCEGDPGACRNMAPLLSPSPTEDATNAPTHRDRCALRFPPHALACQQLDPLLFHSIRAPRLPWSAHLHALFPHTVQHRIATLLLIGTCWPPTALPRELLYLIIRLLMA